MTLPATQAVVRLAASLAGVVPAALIPWEPPPHATRAMGKSTPRGPSGPGPSMRATSESAPRRRYTIRWGKSCSGFSKVTRPSTTSVAVKEVWAWRAGTAV